MQIVKHSYQPAFASVKESLAVIVDGKYTRVWFSDSSYTVKQNTSGTSSKHITGKKAQAIADFAKANIQLSK